MDDFIYFLFLIAWLAFSFYQQGVKKKKRQEQMKAAREREQQIQEELTQEDSAREYQPVEEAPRKSEPQPDFRKTLEDILLGEEADAEETPQPVERKDAKQQETNTMQTRSEQDKNIYQKYFDDEMLEGSQENLNTEPEKLEDKIEELEEEMVLQEEDTIEEPAEKTQFDLRKAVIYSEILNRRYN